ncbi:MAG: efflux RND transporter permease subunit, partial [Gammaproteobacteria bacterium]|nr:efflux RND transporter permease subunit [Gammaproteobacteria bacterium]
DNIARVYTLGFIGLGIALLVLYLFLRRWRAVLVVGISVPVSVTFALAGLYLMGQSELTHAIWTHYGYWVIGRQ